MTDKSHLLYVAHNERLVDALQKTLAEISRRVKNLEDKRFSGGVIALAALVLAFIVFIFGSSNGPVYMFGLVFAFSGMSSLGYTDRIRELAAIINEAEEKILAAGWKISWDKAGRSPRIELPS